MKKFVFALIAFLLMSTPVWAACGGASPTWTAADASEAEFNLCYTLAVSGDTIIIPAGTATWTTTHTLGKEISIIGATTCGGSPLACADSTVITQVGNTFLMTGSNFRISGITFVGNASGYGSVKVRKSGSLVPQIGWRIDHCHFSGSTQFGIYVGTYITSGNNLDYAANYGLIDHNLFSGATNAKVLEQYGDGRTNQGNWDEALVTPAGEATRPPQLGGSKLLFFEDNRTTYTNMADASTIDGDVNAQYVLRFNDFKNAHLTAHGQEEQLGNDPSAVPGGIGMRRSAYVQEIYGNTDDFDDPSYSSYHLQFRGGTGVVFDNVVSGRQEWAYPITYRYPRDDNAATCTANPLIRCMGSNVYDGNEVGLYGYPCWHQPGTAGPNGITKMPYYQWGNTGFGSTDQAAITYIKPTPAECSAGDDHLQAGRDIVFASSGTSLPATCTPPQGYWKTDEGEWNSTNGATPDGRLYKCTATNTWALYYTPFQYPHPLSSTPTAPTGEYISANGTLTPDIHWTHSDTSSQGFRVLLDGVFSKSVVKGTSSGYSTTIPTLTAGKHTLTVQTCNGQGCVSGTTLTIVKM